MPENYISFGYYSTLLLYSLSNLIALKLII